MKGLNEGQSLWTMKGYLAGLSLSALRKLVWFDPTRRTEKRQKYIHFNLYMQKQNNAKYCRTKGLVTLLTLNVDVLQRLFILTGKSRVQRVAGVSSESSPEF